MQSDVIVRTVLQCEKCGETFSDSFEQCPKCGSRRFAGYSVVNPIARLPMESIVRFCGHMLWLAGTVGCILMLWNTNTPDTAHNWWMCAGAFGLLGVSVVGAVTLFAIGEILKRIIRIQRRVRAIMDDHSSQGG